MKRNQGHKPTHTKTNSSEKFTFRYGSNGNIKHFCLYCFKTFKMSGECCSHKLIPISSQARPPRRTAHKSAWKQFIDLFVFGSRIDDIELIERIITIREEFKLPVLELKKRLISLHEIKAEEFDYFAVDKSKSIKLDDKKINDLVPTFIKLCKKFTTENFKSQHEYYMLPICFLDGWDTKILSEQKFYEIYRVRAFHSRIKDRVFNFKIKTRDSNIDILNDNNSYNRANLMYFDSKEKAMAFRIILLRLLYPLIKDKISFSEQLKQSIENDYIKVLRKTPEHLI